MKIHSESQKSVKDLRDGYKFIFFFINANVVIFLEYLQILARMPLSFLLFLTYSVVCLPKLFMEEILFFSIS